MGWALTVKRQRRTMLVRDMCPMCEIEPRRVDGFICGIAECPGRTVKITKNYRAWYSRRIEGIKVNRLFVGNLPYNMTERELRDLFALFGCNDATIIVDPATSHSRGFGYATVADAERAIADMNGQEFGGRKLTVALARERVHKPTPARRRSIKERG